MVFRCLPSVLPLLLSLASGVSYLTEDHRLTGIHDVNMTPKEDLPYPLILPLRPVGSSQLPEDSVDLFYEYVRGSVEVIFSTKYMSLPPMNQRELRFPSGASRAGTFFKALKSGCQANQGSLNDIKKIGLMQFHLKLFRDLRTLEDSVGSLGSADPTLRGINRRAATSEVWEERSQLSLEEFRSFLRSLRVVQEAALLALGQCLGFDRISEAEWDRLRTRGPRRSPAGHYKAVLERYVDRAHSLGCVERSSPFPTTFSLGNMKLAETDTVVAVEPTFSRLRLESAIREIHSFRFDSANSPVPSIIRLAMKYEVPLASYMDLGLLLARSLWFPEAVKADEREVMEVMKRHDWQQQTLSVALLEARNLFRLATSLAGEAGADQGRGEEVSALSRSSEAVSVQSRGPLMSVLEVLGRQAQAQGAAPSFASPEEKRRAEGLIMKRALQVYFRQLSPEEQAHVLSSLKQLAPKTRSNRKSILRYVTRCFAVRSCIRSLDRVKEIEAEAEAASPLCASSVVITLDGPPSPLMKSSNTRPGCQFFEGSDQQSEEEGEPGAQREGTFDIVPAMRAKHAPAGCLSLVPECESLFSVVYRLLKAPSMGERVKRTLFRSLPSMSPRPSAVDSSSSVVSRIPSPLVSSFILTFKP